MIFLLHSPKTGKVRVLQCSTTHVKTQISRKVTRTTQAAVVHTHTSSPHDNTDSTQEARVVLVQIPLGQKAYIQRNLNLEIISEGQRRNVLGFRCELSEGNQKHTHTHKSQKAGVL